MNDRELISDFKKAFQKGASRLIIYSCRQDVGIIKCERGVALGYLEKTEHVFDDQETHWLYYWTDKAKREWGMRT